MVVQPIGSPSWTPIEPCASSMPNFERFLRTCGFWVRPHRNLPLASSAPSTRPLGRERRQWGERAPTACGLRGLIVARKVKSRSTIAFMSETLVACFRVSTREQGRSGLGIDAPRAAVTRFAAAEGYEDRRRVCRDRDRQGADAIERLGDLFGFRAALLLLLLRPNKSWRRCRVTSPSGYRNPSWPATSPRVAPNARGFFCIRPRAAPFCVETGNKGTRYRVQVAACPTNGTRKPEEGMTRWHGRRPKFVRSAWAWK